MGTVKIVNVDYLPVCPHCSTELDEIGSVTTGFLAATRVLVCPHCRKVLGTVYKG